MKFTGTNWVNVGNAGFSAGMAYSESIAISPSDGQPYVAYSDSVNNSKATVKKFNGTNWVDVGNADFSFWNVGWISLAFSPSDGQPYVAYEDLSHGGDPTVMRFNGTDWVNLGNVGFSSGEAWYINLVFSPSDYKPYVAFEDWGHNGKATVMKYDSVFVGINEPRESRLLLYPNPATDKITIETSQTPIQSQLSIMNLNGQEVMTHQITQPMTQMDISSLPQGVYFVRLTNDRTMEVGKFMKQ